MKGHGENAEGFVILRTTPFLPYVCSSPSVQTVNLFDNVNLHHAM